MWAVLGAEEGRSQCVGGARAEVGRGLVCGRARDREEPMCGRGLGRRGEPVCGWCPGRGGEGPGVWAGQGQGGANEWADRKSVV